ncbi:MAG TPA: histidine kinase [Candidatus Limnocylindria bacterium]|jgi:hypothetical protein|nr:histidine kinase [Candidatus Limnocylindria bacterium]
MSMPFASKQGGNTHARAWRGRTVPFFVAWTIMTVAVVGWLLTDFPTSPDLLIAVDRSPNPSLAAQCRNWVATYLGAGWIYPWILLAPYVMGVGMTVGLERRGLFWRLALHGIAGGVFVTLSQWLADRIESRFPQAVLIRREDIVHHRFSGKTNDSADLEVNQAIGWGGISGRQFRFGTDTNGFFEKRIFAGSDEAIKRPPGKESARIVVIRSDRSMTETGDVLVTNRVEISGTNATALSLSSNLVSIIEHHLNNVPMPPLPLAPRRFSAVLDTLAYVGLVGLAQAIHFRRRLGEREKQAMLLESRLAQSQLQVLQSQLQPHFLFNALNGIAMLVRRDPRVAEDMIGSLSELLRLSLQQAGKQLIPLREELEMLDRYLALQQMRFGDRLILRSHIEPATLDCLVPSFLLQPLAENAVRHGVEPSPHSGTITVGARIEGSELVLSVDDDGVGLAADGSASINAGAGIGISSVRDRLAGLYGSRQSLVVANKATPGVEAVIRVPLNPSPSVNPASVP